MQLLVDFFPLIAFFASYKFGGIYVATGVLIVACTLQIAWHWWRTHTVKTLHWVTAALVLVFGSATLLLQDSRFIQWKLSVLMWILAVSFLASHFIGARTLTQRFLESALAEHVGPVGAGVWRRLNLAWVAFFVLVGASNLYVAYHFSEATWVNFKVIGVNVLMLLFLLPQVFWLMPKEQPAGSTTAAVSDSAQQARAERIRSRLQALAPLALDLIDESHLHAGHAGARSGRGHFRVRIVAAAFDALPPIKRHRLVYDALGPVLEQDIHALSIEALAPSEVR